VLGVVRGVTSHVLLGGVAFATLLYFAVKRPSTPHGWGSGFAILSYALASNLVVVIGTIFAERLLYLPSAGLLLVVAAAGTYLYARSGPVGGRALQVAFVAVVLACSLRAWDRNHDYRSEAAFYEEGARTQPRSPKMRLNWSVALSKAGRHQEAMAEAAEAMRLDAGGQDQRDVYASSLDKLGRTPEAITFLSRIVELDSKDRKARRRLIEILTREGRKERADSVLAAGLRVDGEHAEWYALAGQRAQSDGDWGRAVRLWRRATDMSSDAPDAPLYLGFCYLRAGFADSAVTAYREALRRAPESGFAANGLAWAMLDAGQDPVAAMQYARQAVTREATASHYDTLARAALQVGDCESALQAARMAVASDSTGASYKQRLREVERTCGKTGG
jgi:tetratricopeptide (TPR) repeat protein